jgi:hypothetical protein
MVSQHQKTIKKIQRAPPPLLFIIAAYSTPLLAAIAARSTLLYLALLSQLN